MADRWGFQDCQGPVPGRMIACIMVRRLREGRVAAPTQTQIASLTLYPLAIRLRRKFSHAAAERTVADPIVVAVELASHVVGYGETLARPYVTGESPESVLAAIEGQIMPRLLSFRPGSFPDALEAIASLPETDADGQRITAARAAVELALLDAYSRHFHRPITEVAGWLGLVGFGRPGSLPAVRYTGVLSAGEPKAVVRSLRRMRWFGLRDFKLKVGFDGDEAVLRAVVRALGRSLRRGRTTLRIDANGAWQLEQACRALAAWSDLPIAFVEQPLAKGCEKQLVELKRRLPAVRLMHDESLVTRDDAISLLIDRVADGFNLRLSKCGGFLPSLRLAQIAREHGVECQLGCMVGETSILSAAGRRFLECVPRIRFAEGSYGRFLLREDVTRRSVGFGWGGRGRALPEPGWGINVLPDRLRRLCLDRPVSLPL